MKLSELGDMAAMALVSSDDADGCWIVLAAPSVGSHRDTFLTVLTLN